MGSRPHAIVLPTRGCGSLFPQRRRAAVTPTDWKDTENRNGVGRKFGGNGEFFVTLRNYEILCDYVWGRGVTILAGVPPK